MRLSLLVRFALVRWLLWLAGAWARRWVARVAGRALEGAASAYATQPLHEKLGLRMDWRHETIAVLPESERYPLTMAVPKAFVRAALSLPLSGADRWRSVDEARGVYGMLARPALADPAWETDEAFGWLRIAGPNPGWIRRVDAGHVELDYLELLDGLPLRAGCFLYPCRALFSVERAGLHPVEIALRLPSGTTIAVRPDGSPAWRLARRFVHAADIFVHEVVSHFLWTHVHAERIILTTARHLDPGHPIRELLAPHLAFTLQANENSARVLLGPGGVFDRAFSAGWEGTDALLVRGEQEWSFDRMVPGRDAAARGCHGLPSYPWLEDATLLWNALTAHVARALGGSSPDAAALAWAAALRDPFPRGFPVVADSPSLVLVVTACLYTNVRHTLVNAAQYDSFGFPPAWPAMVRAPFPDDPAQVDEAWLDRSLPGVVASLDAIRATYAFSIQFSRLSASGADLAGVSAEIARRNAGRSRPYRLADPPRVSGSINA